MSRWYSPRIRTKMSEEHKRQRKDHIFFLPKVWKMNEEKQKWRWKLVKHWQKVDSKKILGKRNYIIKVKVVLCSSVDIALLTSLWNLVLSLQFLKCFRPEKLRSFRSDYRQKHRKVCVGIKFLKANKTRTQNWRIH